MVYSLGWCSLLLFFPFSLFLKLKIGFSHIIYYIQLLPDLPTFPPTQIYIPFLSLSRENKQVSKKINEILLCASVALSHEWLPNFNVFIPKCIACSHPHCFQVSHSWCLAMTMLQSHTFVKYHKTNDSEKKQMPNSQSQKNHEMTENKIPSPALLPKLVKVVILRGGQEHSLLKIIFP